MRVKCFDVFNMVKDSLGEEFKSKHKISEDKLNLLYEECEAFDEVAASAPNIGFTVVISEDTCDISISLDFMYDISIILEDVPFMDIIQENTKSMVITKTDTEDVLQLTFVFDGVWD